MIAGDVALYLVAGINVVFWFGVIPLIIVSLIIAGGCRAWFGVPVVVWRGIETPRRVANLVLKAAETAHADEEEGSDEEAGMFDRLRR